jgi:hypothetical protein
VIYRGKTARSEAALREHFTREIQMGRLVLMHQENGRANRVVVRRDLQWLSDIVKGQNLCLLWDLFSAHHEEQVKRKAEEVHTALEFTPAGLTDEWQSLDLRIFGSLKMRARGLFNDQWLRDESIEFTVATSIALLLKAWESITQEEILGAWNKVIPLW